MKALLVQPRSPNTYWGFQHALHLVGKATSLPPLGLATLAAQLPQTWELRVRDLNVAPLSSQDLRWADALLLTGMLVHEPSMHEVLLQARAAGLRTVVGGPGVTSSPQRFDDADHLFLGESEGRLDLLVRTLESGEGPRMLAPCAGARPDLRTVPPPRYDLLERKRYSSMSLQYSRGCPFSCEFCDIVELFGRVPRVKPPEAVLAELDALQAMRWRGPVFIVDDNFIGNRRAVLELLPHLIAWQRAHGFPFEFYTEASVDLAAAPKLLHAMVEAGFGTVFLGIETTSVAALKDSHKLQNLKMAPDEAVRIISAAGMEVLSGFIVGFDSDSPEIFEAQRRFIQGLPIASAMVGLLTALEGTALWRRLKKEGRLRGSADGDQFCRPNFEPRMDERVLVAGYRHLLARLYSPEAYYARCRTMVAQLGRSRSRPLTLEALRMLLRVLYRLGVRSPRRGHFWRLVARALLRPHTLPRAMVLAVQGEHFIRYTREDVLPRLDATLAELSRQQPALSAGSPGRG